MTRVRITQTVLNEDGNPVPITIIMELDVKDPTDKDEIQMEVTKFQIDMTGNMMLGRYTTCTDTEEIEDD